MKLRRSCIDCNRRKAGSFVIDVTVAMTLLVLVAIPFALGYINSEKQMRQAYYRAVALEVVDAEAEILAAGLLRQYPEGESNYPVLRGAATHLPPGTFRLGRTGNTGTLEWRSQKPMPGGTVRRSFRMTHGGLKP